MKIFPFFKFNKSLFDHEKEKRIVFQFYFFNLKTKIKYPLVFIFWISFSEKKIQYGMDFDRTSLQQKKVKKKTF